MRIQLSTDWAAVEKELLSKAQALPHASQDLTRMTKNISRLVSQLSLEEINCRRLQKQTIKHAELIEEINKQIGVIDQLVTFAALIQRT